MRAVYFLLMGDPRYVGWVVNAAASVKYYNPALHIVLLYQPGMYEKIPSIERKSFDEFIEIDNSICHDGTKLTPGITKLNLYQYFKHDENLYIDADSLILKDISALFDQNSHKTIATDVVWQGTELSEKWPCHWATLESVKRFYKFPKNYSIYEVNSSYIYSKKNKKAEKFWDQARKNIIPNYIGKWGKSFPDELAFNVAFAQTGIDPSGKIAISWNSKLNNISQGVGTLDKHYFILTYWGGKNNAHVGHYQNYDALAGKIHREYFGKHNPYKYRELMQGKYIQTNRTTIGNSQKVEI